MATSTLISVSEYLASSYRPDQEYIDGQLLERNMGELDHSWLQGEALLHFAGYRRTMDLRAFPEWRVQRIGDYLAFGVENIWISDPGRRKGFWADSTGIHEAADGVLRTRDELVDMDLDAMWQ